MKAATLKLNIWTDNEQQELPDDYSDLAELFAPHVQHVVEMCCQGYRSGEIVDDRFDGWWTIEETTHSSAKTATHRRRSIWS